MFFQDLRHSGPLNAGCSIEKHANLPMKCWPNASVTMRHLERCCCVCINGSFHQKILRSFDAFTRNPRRSFNTFTEKHHPRASAAEPKKLNSYQEDPKGWAHTDFSIRVRAEIRVLGPRPLLEQSPLLELLGYFFLFLFSFKNFYEKHSSPPFFPPQLPHRHTTSHTIWLQWRFNDAGQWAHKLLWIMYECL